VSTNSSFTALVYDYVGGSGNHDLSGLDPNTTHYMRTLASNATGNIGWTTTTTFKTLAGSWAHVNNVWVQADAHVYNNGWKNLTVFKRVGSTWKQ